MDKIPIACMAIMLLLVIMTALFESFESFKRQSLHFVLFKNKTEAFKSIFIYENQSVNGYIKSRPGMMAQMVTSFLKKEVRSLLQEIEGLEIDKCIFGQKQKHQLAAEAKELRNKKIEEFYVAIGSPPF